MERKKLLAVVVAVVVISNSVLAYVSNGSFEDWDVPSGNPGYQQITIADTQLPGWFIQANGANDFIDLADANSILWGGQTTAAEGKQFIRLHEDTHLTQTMHLSPGTYNITFSYTGQFGLAGNEGAAFVSFSTVSGSQTNLSKHFLSYSGTNSLSNPDWQTAQFSLVVPAGATETTIEFYGKNYPGASGGPNMLIDNVNIPFDGDCAEYISLIGAKNGDISGPEGVPDCKIDLYDFAALAGNWTFCYDPVESHCQ